MQLLLIKRDVTQLEFIPVFYIENILILWAKHSRPLYPVIYLEDVNSNIRRLFYNASFCKSLAATIPKLQAPEVS